MKKSVKDFGIARQRLSDKGRELINTKEFKTFLAKFNDIPDGTKLKFDSPVFTELNKNKLVKELSECMKDFVETLKVSKLLVYGYSYDKIKSLLDINMLPIFMVIMNDIINSENDDMNNERGFITSVLTFIENNFMDISTSMVDKLNKEELNGGEGNNITIH